MGMRSQDEFCSPRLSYRKGVLICTGTEISPPVSSRINNHHSSHNNNIYSGTNSSTSPSRERIVSSGSKQGQKTVTFCREAGLVNVGLGSVISNTNTSHFSSTETCSSCHSDSDAAVLSKDRRRSIAISNILQGNQRKEEATSRRSSFSHIHSSARNCCASHQDSSTNSVDLEEEEKLMAYLNQQPSYNNPYSQNNGHPPNQNQTNNMNNNNNTPPRKDSHHHPPKEFIPSFVLVDLCKANHERKVRDIVRRMSSLRSEDVDPVVNFQDSSGRTALSYACASGNVMLIDELSKLRRLDPNLGDNEKNTPLHYASQAGHSEVVDLLLTRFDGVIDINCRNITGLSPLMKAGLQGRTRCAKSLIAAGASAHLRDYSRSLTAAEWARLCGRHMTAEVILRCAKDNYQNPHSPTSTYSRHRPLPVSQSALELKRINSEESPYYHLYAARNTISAATWLKNKIKKALGSSDSGNVTTSGFQSNGNHSYGIGQGGRKSESFALLANLSGPTICAGSLILPNLKPLIEQQGKFKKLTIPTVQVTQPVSKR